LWNSGQGNSSFEGVGSDGARLVLQIAGAVLEGSVRMAGNRVRITTML
jgi:TolB-like protein